MCQILMNDRRQLYSAIIATYLQEALLQRDAIAQSKFYQLLHNSVQEIQNKWKNGVRGLQSTNV